MNTTVIGMSDCRISQSGFDESIFYQVPELSAPNIIHASSSDFSNIGENTYFCEIEERTYRHDSTGIRGNNLFCLYHVKQCYI